ncbi:MAG: CHAD domain-containing protein [Solirubrobacteraceae bacterium]
MSTIELSTDQSYAEAARAVIAARADDVFARDLERVLDPDQPEGVHKMRVATRRLRAALEIFGPAFPAKRLADALSEVKLLAGALGERRDCDVQIELLESIRRDARRIERHAVDALIAELRRDQHAANAHLVVALEHTKDARLARRLRRLAS